MQGLKTPQAAYHVPLARIVRPLELYLSVIAVPAWQALTRHLPQLVALPVVLVVGRPQTHSIVPIAYLARTTLRQDLGA
jgi:hypothetical protein